MSFVVGAAAAIAAVVVRLHKPSVFCINQAINQSFKHSLIQSLIKQIIDSNQ
jgi:hypothetical protein